MKHYKEIEVMCTGQIVARVFSKVDDRRVAYKFFNTSFLESFKDANTPENVEKRCKEAHKWADEMIVVVDKYEVKAGEVLDV